MVNSITIWLSCFCAGAISAVFWRELPSTQSMAVMLALLVVTSSIILFYQNHGSITGQAVMEVLLCLAINGLFVGVLWVASLGHFYYAWQLPQHKIQQDVTIVGHVISGGCLSDDLLNAQDYHQYIVAIQSVDGQSTREFFNPPFFKALLFAGLKFKVRLSHSQYRAENHGVTSHLFTFKRSDDESLPKKAKASCLHDGDVFTAVAKLKPAYGVANPVGFSRQQYLVSHFIYATGYIKVLHTETTFHEHSHRNELADWLSSLNLTHHSWWSALLLGNKTHFTQDDWILLQRTGTGHLFSISGMHLSIVAGVCFFIFIPFIFILVQVFELLRRLRRFASLQLVGFYAYKIQHKGCLFSLKNTGLRVWILVCVIAVCYLYALLSGMALPVVRALLLLTLGCLLTIFKVAWRSVNIGLAMLALCLLLFPFSVLNASFYLSIGAVICIWFFINTLSIHREPWYFAIIKLQIALTVIMMPLTTIWFGNVSVVSLVANLLALPVITLLLPICLISLLISYYLSTSFVGNFAVEVLKWSDYLFGYLLSLLAFLSDLDLSAFTLFIDTSGALCFLGAIILFCLPCWRFKRFCLFLLSLPLATSLIQWLPPNDEVWALHVLDAGQASAITVTKGDSAIIIDSGAQYGGNALTATQYLLPLLKSVKVKQVDHVIHTHSDNDHAGGLRAIMVHPIAKNAKFYSPTLGCERDTHFDWQGLTISFLWPLKGNAQDNNAMSCVVRISDPSGSVLIPGDIEKESEYALITKEFAKGTSALNADILIAPHHGSNTSSTDIFIKHVSPKAVIYTQGYENRWKFPALNVVERYKQHNVQQYFTSSEGYTLVTLEKGTFHVKTLRGDLKKRWYLKGRSPRHL